MNAQKPKDSLEPVTLAAAGDPDARRALVERLRPRMHGIALAILGNQPDAEDASQAIMIEILSSAGSYRGDNLLGWADRIAARTAMRHARKRRVRATQVEPDFDVDELPRAPNDSIADHETPRPLVHYLAALPEARRVVLVLRHVMDYSIDEIAELTSVSRNTVKDRLLHAREQMRRLIRRDLAIAEARRRP
ncbi:MAG: sigma-70 family RNA polymerase sigma factor [Polyangiaceae bacterium]